MPSLRFVQALVANTPIVNLLNGSKFEFLPVPSMIEVFGCCDVGGCLLELTMGNVIEFDQMEAPIFINTAGGPNVQDHRLGGGIGAAGDRVVLKVMPGAVGAALPLSLRVLIVITPV